MSAQDPAAQPGRPGTVWDRLGRIGEIGQNTLDTFWMSQWADAQTAQATALSSPGAGAVSAVSLRDVYTGQPVALLEDASRAGSGGAGGDEAAARIHHMAFSPAGTLLVSCTGMGHNVL